MEKKELIRIFSKFIRFIYQDHQSVNEITEKISTAPYFVFILKNHHQYLSIDNGEASFDAEIVFKNKDIIFNENQLVLPFETFIIDSMYDDDLKDEDEAQIIIRTEEELIILKLFRHFINPYLHNYSIYFYAVAKDIPFNIIKTWDNGTGKDYFYNYYLTCCKLIGNEFIIDNEMTAKFKNDNKLSSDMIFKLSFFLSFVNSRDHIIIQKYDPKFKNSPEFIQSNSHYLILPKHLGNKVVEKELTEFNGIISKKNISAHLRRSHIRILRAERFKNNKGKKIIVKSAWVGPKEWFGSDKKIYKVYEPPNSHMHTA